MNLKNFQQHIPFKDYMTLNLEVPQSFKKMGKKIGKSLRMSTFSGGSKTSQKPFRKRKIKINRKSQASNDGRPLNEKQLENEQILINIVELDTPSLIMHLISIDILKLINEIYFLDYVPLCLIQVVWKVSGEKGNLASKILTDVIHSQFFIKIQEDFFILLQNFSQETELNDHQFAIYQLIHAVDSLLDQFPEYYQLFPIEEIKEQVDTMDAYCKKLQITPRIPLIEMLFLSSQLQAKLNQTMQHIPPNPLEINSARLSTSSPKLASPKKKVTKKKSSKSKKSSAPKTKEADELLEYLNNYHYQESIIQRQIIQAQIKQLENSKKNQYLDSLFDTLVETVNKPLIEAVQAYIEDREGIEKIMIQGKKIQIYEKLILSNIMISNDEVYFQFKYLSKYYKSNLARVIKKCIPGQMVLLSPDKFKTQFIGLTKKRDPERMHFTDEKWGYVNLNIQVINAQTGGFLSIVDFYREFNQAAFDVILLNQYYEQTIYTLQKLQSMTSWYSLPFQDYILEERQTKPLPPHYVTFGFSEEILDDIFVDSEVREALLFCLQNEIAVVKGCPGSGKSWLIQSLIRVLFKMIDNWRSRGPILFISKNSSVLDQCFDKIREYSTYITTLEEVSVNNCSYKEYSVFEKCKNSEKMEKLTGGMRNALELQERLFFQQKVKLNMYQCGFINSRIDNPSINNILNTLEMDFILELKRIVPLKIGEQSKDIEDRIWKFLMNLLQLQKDLTVIFWLGILNIETYIDSLIKNENGYLDKSYQEIEKQLCEGYSKGEGGNEGSAKYEKVRDENYYIEESKMSDDEYKLEEYLNFFCKQFQKGFENEYFGGCLTFDECLQKGKAIGMLQNIENSLDKNLFSYSITMRWKINNTILLQQEQEITSVKKSLEIHLAEYQKQVAQKAEMESYCQSEFLKEADIILLNIDSYAKFQKVVQSMSIPIIIIEQGSDMIEPSIISYLSKKTEHLIIVGDSSPSIATPQFQNNQGHSLDSNENRSSSSLAYDQRSVIQKLIDCSYHTFFEFQFQKRMRPEIAQLLSFEGYVFSTNKNLLELPPIKGVTTNLYFFDSNAKQNLSDFESFSMSEIIGNQSEMLMLIKFTNYLLLQGYNPDVVKIVTMNKSQVDYLNELKMTCKCRDVFDVQITSTSNLIGLEADIVIFYLTWSSVSELAEIRSKILQTVSRAKYGLYIFSSSQVLIDHDPEFWNNVIPFLKGNNMIGEELNLICQTHSNQTSVREPEDFNQVLFGGCQQTCNSELKCSHKCSRRCHPFQLNNHYPKGHNGQKCKQICSGKSKKCGHPCIFKCYKCQPNCRPCSTIVEKKMLACNHLVTVECSKIESLQLCPKECDRILKCGHKCIQQCFESCYKLKCKIPTDKEYPCGHKNTVPCCMSIDEAVSAFPCTSDCTTIMECGHVCVGKCIQCAAKGHHKMCRQDCIKRLVCGHQCKNQCSKVCPPCDEDECSYYCEHDVACKNCCSEECSDCKLVCVNKCEHTACTKKCFEVCDRKPCNKQCELTLQCGHKCLGLCGEVCPKLCRECNPDDELIQLEGKDPLAKFIQLDCSHIFELQDFDTAMSGQYVKEKAKKLLECPKCKAHFKKVKRYMRLQKQIYKNLKKVKEELLDYTEDYEHLQREVERWVKGMHEQIDNCGIKCQYIKYLQTQFRKITLNKQKIKILRCNDTMRKFLRRIQLEHLILPINLYYHYFQTSLFQKSVKQYVTTLANNNQEEFGIERVKVSLESEDHENDSLRVELQIQYLGTVICIWHKCSKGHVFTNKEINGVVEIKDCQECNKRGTLIGNINDMVSMLTSRIQIAGLPF